MSFYIDMHAKYCPETSMQEFDIIMNKLETDLFNLHPEYLKLAEKDQNRLVEEFYRERYFTGVK